MQETEKKIFFLSPKGKIAKQTNNVEEDAGKTLFPLCAIDPLVSYEFLVVTLLCRNTFNPLRDKMFSRNRLVSCVVRLTLKWLVKRGQWPNRTSSPLRLRRGQNHFFIKNLLFLSAVAHFNKTFLLGPHQSLPQTVDALAKYLRR